MKDRIPPNSPATEFEDLLELPQIAPVAFDDFLDTPILHSLMGRSKIDFIGSSSRIIIRAPPNPYHDCSPPFLRRVLQALQRASFDTPARQDTLQVCESSWRASDGSYLVPDAAVAVLDIESDDPPRLWPTIVVEVARSNTYDSAVEKVGRWFRASDGMVEVALLLQFTEKDPLVNPECFIEVFRCRRISSPGARPGGDYQLRFGMVEPDTGLAGDGDHGFHRVGGFAARDTTGLRSAHLIPARGSASAAVATGDNPTVSGNTSRCKHHRNAALYDYRTLSNVQVYLDRLPPTVETYQDGPRYIVVGPPSSDSAHQHIVLQYSDFFGRENVPVGRDPAEKVYLQLDLLRKELLVRLRLTQAQVGSLKRNQSTDEGLGGDEKRAKMV